MAGTIINVVLVLLGSVAGLLLKGLLSSRLSTVITQGLGLCVALIGLQSAIGYGDLLCVIICLVLGVLIGEGLKIERRLDGLGEVLRKRFVKEGSESRFTEGFVTASILYCVGAMAIMGSIEAGVNQNYSILIAKSIIDGITSITFAAAMGIGVAFSVLPILIYQGGLTLLAAQLGGFFVNNPATIEALSAVGGVIIIGIGVNMLGATKERIPVGNMLPAIFLPLLYLPVSNALAGLF
jgi:Uncharacterized membrane protein, possible Na+ channel or pump